MTPSSDPDERSYRIRLPPKVKTPSRREPAFDIAEHAAPLQVIILATTAQNRPPQVTHCLTKRAQRRPIHGHPVIAEVAGVRQISKQY
jgi:hypothetical protein